MKMPKRINIAGMVFSVTVGDTPGMSFDYNKREIRYSSSLSGHFMQEAIVHEISEIIHVLLGNRLSDMNNDSYEFRMTHRDFQVHNEILINTLINNNLIKFL